MSRLLRPRVDGPVVLKLIPPRIRARLRPLRARARALRGVPGRLRTKYRRLRLRLQVLRRLRQKEAEWEVAWRHRQPRWWRYGFLSRSAILYDLENNGPEHYVSDLKRYLNTKRMVHPRLQDVINNKLTTHLLLRAMDIPSTELLGVYWRGAVHRFPAEQRTPLVEYLNSLSAGQQVFVKPLTGAEGKRIFAVRRLDNGGFRLNGIEVPLAAVRAEIEADKRPMVVEAGLEQHRDEAALFEGTTNTLRLLTMLDMKDRTPFIVVAVQRIGAGTSGVVDNWSAGGLSARIDLDSGRLGKATRLPGPEGLRWFSTHPDNGAPIEGVQVPYWGEVVDTVLHAARVLSFMEYIGWDVIVTPQGPVVLEANINSGMNVLQVHQPLLKDPRARAYFVKRGVVST